MSLSVRLLGEAISSNRLLSSTWENNNTPVLWHTIDGLALVTLSVLFAGALGAGRAASAGYIAVASSQVAGRLNLACLPGGWVGPTWESTTGAGAAWKGHRWNFEPMKEKPVDGSCSDLSRGGPTRCCHPSDHEHCIYFWLSGGKLGVGRHSAVERR